MYKTIKIFLHKQRDATKTIIARNLTNLPVASKLPQNANALPTLTANADAYVLVQIGACQTVTRLA
jgi:hypothetical protein